MKYQIDLETMSTKTNAVIMSIGICDENGDGDQIYLPKQPQLNVGRCVDQETVDWWREPERAEYYEELKENCYKAFIDDVAVWDVHRFILNFLHARDDGPKDQREIWMNSPAFDGVILETLFLQFALKTPWHYRNPRDFRTLKNLARQKFGGEIALPKEPENLHDALVDCQWQMVQTKIYLRILGI